MISNSPGAKSWMMYSGAWLARLFLSTSSTLPFSGAYGSPIELSFARSEKCH